MRNSWSVVMAPRGSSAPRHSGTGAGACRSMRPSRTATPTKAAITLLALDQDRSGVSGPIPGA